jgi:hypothetical protein
MNGRMRAIGELIGWTVFAMALGCNSGDEVLGTIDGRADDIGEDDGGAPDDIGEGDDGDTDGVTDTGGPDSPGSCFEIFGPTGISHQPPRMHDVGIVTLGESRMMSIRFYNFCEDPAARLLALEWLDGPGDFAVTSGPAIGDLFSRSAMGTIMEVAFVPAGPGMQYARLRVSVSHGYYDFEFAGEGVAAGGEPALLDLVCLEADRHVDLGRVALVATPTAYYLRLPLLCDFDFGTGHLVVESAAVTAGSEVFSLDPPGSSYAGVVANIELGSPALLDVPLLFVPTVAGTYDGELTVDTNDRNGTYVVSFAATAD